MQNEDNAHKEWIRELMSDEWRTAEDITGMVIYELLGFPRKENDMNSKNMVECNGSNGFRDIMISADANIRAERWWLS